MKDVGRGPRALVVPLVDGLGMSEAVRDLIERLRLPPVYRPARHLSCLRSAAAPAAICAALSYGRSCAVRGEIGEAQLVLISPARLDD